MNSFEKSKKFFLEGIELYSKQNYKEAVIKFTNSLELEPNRPSILLNLSKSYLQIKQLENAKNNLEKIIKLNGFENEKKEALNLLLNIYLEIDDFEEINKLKNINNAEEIFNNKDYVKLQFYYPKLFNSFEEIPNARNEFRGNIKKLLNDKYLPKLDLIDDPIIPPNFSLSYDGYDNLEINKELISIYKKLYPKLNDEIGFSNNKNKKIKIGFISEFFTNHTIIKLFEGLMYKLDKSKFDVFVIYSHKTLPGSRHDEIKRNSILYNYENVFLPKNFSEKVEIIKEYNLDILFYTDIHMSENLYFLTLLKLARYQITSWGHPETTGNSKIDFFLSSTLLETDNFKKKYSEKVLLSKPPRLTFAHRARDFAVAHHAPEPNCSFHCSSAERASGLTLARTWRSAASKSTSVIGRGCRSPPPRITRCSKSESRHGPIAASRQSPFMSEPE